MKTKITEKQIESFSGLTGQVFTNFTVNQKSYKENKTDVTKISFRTSDKKILNYSNMVEKFTSWCASNQINVLDYDIPQCILLTAQYQMNSFSNAPKIDEADRSFVIVDEVFNIPSFKLTPNEKDRNLHNMFFEYIDGEERSVFIKTSPTNNRYTRVFIKENSSAQAFAQSLINAIPPELLEAKENELFETIKTYRDVINMHAASEQLSEGELSNLILDSLDQLPKSIFCGYAEIVRKNKVIEFVNDKGKTETRRIPMGIDIRQTNKTPGISYAFLIKNICNNFSHFLFRRLDAAPFVYTCDVNVNSINYPKFDISEHKVDKYNILSITDTDEKIAAVLNKVKIECPTYFKHLDCFASPVESLVKLAHDYRKFDDSILSQQHLAIPFAAAGIGKDSQRQATAYNLGSTNLMASLKGEEPLKDTCGFQNIIDARSVEWNECPEHILSNDGVKDLLGNDKGSTVTVRKMYAGPVTFIFNHVWTFYSNNNIAVNSQAERRRVVLIRTKSDEDIKIVEDPDFVKKLKEELPKMLHLGYVANKILRPNWGDIDTSVFSKLVKNYEDSKVKTSDYYYEVIAAGFAKANFTIPDFSRFVAEELSKYSKAASYLSADGFKKWAMANVKGFQWGKQAKVKNVNTRIVVWPGYENSVTNEDIEEADLFNPIANFKTEFFNMYEYNSASEEKQWIDSKKLKTMLEKHGLDFQTDIKGQFGFEQIAHVKVGEQWKIKNFVEKPKVETKTKFKPKTFNDEEFNLGDF